MTTSQLGNNNAAEELQLRVKKLSMFCSHLITYFVVFFSVQEGDDDKSGEESNAVEELQALLKKDPNLLGKLK
jgi:hypothetical protein